MVYLGIDGGGTKTAFSLMDDKGKVLAKREKGTIHLMQISEEEFLKCLQEGVKEVLQDSLKRKEDIAYSFIGIPGFGEYVEKKEAAQKMVHQVLGESVTMGNDCVAGWAGSLKGKPGINVVVGTGSIAFGVDSKGNEARSGGWGPYFGDEASAYWFGKKVLEVFSKESDGRYEKNRLYDLVKETFNPVSDFQMIEFFHSQMEQERQKVAELAPLLTRAALEGDPYAYACFEQGAREIAQCVFAVISLLEFQKDEIILVSLSGGVTKSKDLLTEPLKEALKKDSRIKLVERALEPWQGALLLAYQQQKGSMDEKILRELEESWQV